MKTIQMTIDDDLLMEVDQLIEQLDTTRSAFMRRALRTQIQKHKIAEMERRHRESYTLDPIQPDEFEDWSEAQAWEDE